MEILLSVKTGPSREHHRELDLVFVSGRGKTLVFVQFSRCRIAFAAGQGDPVRAAERLTPVPANVRPREAPDGVRNERLLPGTSLR
jgi:hypothetical protein